MRGAATTSEQTPSTTYGSTALQCEAVAHGCRQVWGIGNWTYPRGAGLVRILPGFPITRAPGGTSKFTNAPGAITAPLPMVIPPMTTAFCPTHTPSSRHGV